MIQQLSNDSFDEAVRGSPSLYAVRFLAQWCGPCHAMSPIFSEVAQELQGSAKFGEVDIDAAPDLASRYGVRSIPAVLLFRDGEVIDRIAGSTTKARFVNFISPHLA